MRLFLLFLILFYVRSSWASFSVQEVQRSGGYSPWSLSFFSLASTVQEENDKGGGRMSSYNYFSTNYRLFGGRKIAFRLPFTYATAGYDSFHGERLQKSEIQLQDPFLSYTIYNLVLLPFDIGVFWEGRIYAPVSRMSQDIGMRTRLRSDMYFSKLLSRHWEIEYVTKINYYAQSQSIAGRIGVDSVTGENRVYIGNTKKMFLDHWLSIWYKFDSNTGLGFKLGGEETLYNKSDALSREAKREIKFGPQVRFSLSSKANFLLSMEYVMNPRYLSQNRGLKGLFAKSALDTQGKKANRRDRRSVQWVLLSFLRF